MKAKLVKQIHAYKVSLTATSKDGSFSCPHCGTKISPDDDSEAAYSILETSVDRFGLEEVVVRCNRCHNSIHLAGFPKAQEPLDIRAKSAGKENDLWFVAHV